MHTQKIHPNGPVSIPWHVNGRTPRANQNPQDLVTKFFIPEAMLYIQKYIRTYQICQESEMPRNMPTIFEIRVLVSFRPYDWMSMDIKDIMLCLKSGFTAILVATCKITNWVTAIPIWDMTTQNSVWHTLFTSGLSLGLTISHNFWQTIIIHIKYDDWIVQKIMHETTLHYSRESWVK